MAIKSILFFSSLSIVSPFGYIEEKEKSVRVATYNLALNRNSAGELISDLQSGDDQASAVAEIIQRNDPDIILLNEFDYDENGEALELFRTNYLEISQNDDTSAIEYEYYFLAASNTGIQSGQDFNKDGSTGSADDAFGFGFFEGQYGMALLSKYPIVSARTFQKFLWKDMPDGLFDLDDYYTADDLEVFRLSSKSHWDCVINVDGNHLHILASHPTPPVFDGPEDRNGRRNHDEIKFWSDYVGGLDYMYDDNGIYGGLDENEKYFVVAGDLNADPFDGDSYDFAARLLTDNERFNNSPTPSSDGGVYASESQAGYNLEHNGNPAYDTADFGWNGFNTTIGAANPDTSPGNLRADYVLPSTALKIEDAKVFWLTPDDPLWPLGEFPDSDHRLVYIDAVFT